MCQRRLVALSAPLLLGIALWTGGCSPRPACCPDSKPESPAAFPQPAQGEFSVMTFNLHRYALQDQDQGASPLEPRPRPESEALVDAVRQAERGFEGIG